MGHTSGRMFRRNVGLGTPVNGTVFCLVEKVFSQPRYLLLERSSAALLAIPLPQPRPRPLPATGLTGDRDRERACQFPCLPPLPRVLPRLVDLPGRVILAGISGTPSSLSLTDVSMPGAGT